ncbi:MAG TPA: NADH-quinone oxidoreductase subunit J [Candidatus Eisenbacteria bacterium]|nr:NADH-quinone oxidoreductase subunit J [Candidatus Eisenbacteria bacterium]
MFAGIAVGCALAVVFHRNQVHCALFLIAVLLSVSGLFILLSASFIAALQVLVYAGAIMVLFLFVLMLLGAKDESPLLTRGAMKGFGILFAIVAFAEVLWVLLAPSGEPPDLAGSAPLPEGFGSPASIGRVLYTVWLFPFEITSILLLVAVIGAVVLAKRKFG